MKKLLMLVLMSITLNVTAKTITEHDYADMFKDYHACFILYNLHKNKVVSEYNPQNYCNERIAPNSTFKVPLSLMAFDKEIINQNTVFQWDGVKGVLPEHDQNQTPATWIKYSVLWVSQQLAPQLGKSSISKYLADFNYGNQDFSGDAGKNNGLTHAWLSSSLKISAIEQRDFLKRMLTNKLSLSESAVEHTTKNMYLGKLENGDDYYGKTGSGRHGVNERESNPSKLRDGWFVGFIDHNQERYIFISNLTDKSPVTPDPIDGSLKPYGSQILKPITMKILNTYFDK